MLLGIAYAASDSVWFPITATGSEAWTEGSFGLEASVPAVVVSLIAAAVLGARVLASRR